MKVEVTGEDGVHVVSHEISKEGEEEKGDESNMREKTSLEAELKLLEIGLQLLAKHHFCIDNGIKDCHLRPACFSRFLNRSDDIVKRLPKDDADRNNFLDELQKIDLVKMLELLVKLFDINPILKKGSAELQVKQAEHEGREAKLQVVLQADSSLARACQADIDNHLSRFLLGSREWIIHLYSQWLKEGSISDLNSTIPVVSSLRHVQQMHQRRAFVIYGAAGIGKSTVAAKLCNMERRESSIYAFHFCRHGDVLRRDPVAMIKSLALQLALELPFVYKEIMGLASSDQNLPSQETSGNHIERTFKLLLLGPLLLSFLPMSSS
ncbi:hypothetical protein CEUSTIGMA_g10537.t1 [Chlamydomonas eustigma]|uniref:Nephrocystin 3-like N-terminal domain-containing protein n=1 Tax=Chlamydomonas eustigma TaxID=1157962 RepID=A0A250XJ49_9CHLO|nr:hypothetical protein CEUSTIGMA_g10537.t1 [Chlamydomonas eustigma]|eukprot:GAX83111.1 hypothetical protein CEUSTIGMA_g10537.t1 [Chlamydomonas eustigma]